MNPIVGNLVGLLRDGDLSSLTQFINTDATFLMSESQVHLLQTHTSHDARYCYYILVKLHRGGLI